MRNDPLPLHDPGGLGIFDLMAKGLVPPPFRADALRAVGPLRQPRADKGGACIGTEARAAWTAWNAGSGPGGSATWRHISRNRRMFTTSKPGYAGSNAILCIRITDLTHSAYVVLI